MTPVLERVKKHQDALRMSGFRPVQILVPDTRAKGFHEECKTQARLVAQSDRRDFDMNAFLDESIAGVDGWE